MQAVILAAGRGTRMRPLSDVTPKPMLPVGDRPLAAHVADAAVEAGASELVFVVGYRADHVRAYFGSEYAGVPVAYATQSSADGTADAVRAASHHVDGPFAVLNGDNLFDPESVVDLFDHDAAVAAHRVDDPTEYGVLSTSGRTVTGVVEKPDDPPSHLANAGAYVFPASATEDLDVPPSSRGERELTDVLARVVDRREVTAVETDRWLDVARPGDVLAANALALEDLEESGRAGNDRMDGLGVEDDHEEPVADTVGAVRVAPDASIHPRATIEGPVVVRNGANVEANVTLRGPAVVGPDATVARGSSIENSVLLADATVDTAVQLRGVVVGPGCELTGNCIAGVTTENGRGAASVVANDAAVASTLRY